MPLSKKETERKRKNFEKCTHAYRVYFRHRGATYEHEAITQANVLFRGNYWQRALQLLHANGMFNECIRVRQWTGHRKTEDDDDGRLGKVSKMMMMMRMVISRIRMLIMTLVMIAFMSVDVT